MQEVLFGEGGGRVDWAGRGMHIKAEEEAEADGQTELRGRE